MGTPLPTHLKSLRGNPGRRPLNDKEPEPPLTAPAAPEMVQEDPVATDYWNIIAAKLTRLKVLSEIDGSALAIVCVTYSRWKKAEAALRKFEAQDKTAHGLITKTSNGNFVQNPLVGVANVAMRDHQRALAEFGMTPSSRSKIISSGSESKNPYASLYGS